MVYIMVIDQSRRKASQEEVICRSINDLTMEIVVEECLLGRRKKPWKSCICPELAIYLLMIKK
jgi:hypothetical protein